MVEGPGCKLKGEKMSAVVGQHVTAVSGNAVDRHTKGKKQAAQSSPFHDLIGNTISEIKTLGKELFMFFKEFDMCLRVHFLMAGGFRLNGQNLDGEGGGEAKSATLELQLSKDALRFNKSSVELRKSDDCLGKLGAMVHLDICSSRFNHSMAVEKVTGQTGRLLCDVLLDQDVLPGVGNIIKNEALFDSGISPDAKVEILTPDHISHLVKMTRDFSMLFYKCRKEGKSLYPFLKIYRKGKCGQCDGKITTTRMGETNARYTSFCPTCQTNDLQKSRKLPLKNSLIGWVKSNKTVITQCEWDCSVCTLKNGPARKTCEVCLTPKVDSSTSTDQSLSVMDKSKVDALCGNGVSGGNWKRKHALETQEESTSLLQAHVGTAKAGPPAKKLKSKSEPHEVKKEMLYVESPTCPEHKSKCIMREVRKKGSNEKRFFWSCPFTKGNCNFFQWADEKFPTCEGHGKACVIRTVLKQGTNNGRRFFACKREKKNACKFFQWADEYANITIR